MKQSKSRMVWGLSLIAASILIGAEMMGYLPKEINWFKLSMSIFMVMSALVCLLRSQFSKAIMLVTFSIMVSRNNLGISVSYWTLLLIGLLFAIGVALIFKDKSFSIQGDVEGMDCYDSVSHGNHQITSVFGSRSRRIEKDFVAYLKVESVFSSLDIFLDSAVLNGTCTLEIESVFSSTKIYVSSNTQVVTNLQNVFAGVSNYGSGKANGPTLFIKGENVFGKIEVFYV